MKNTIPPSTIACSALTIGLMLLSCGKAQKTPGGSPPPKSAAKNDEKAISGGQIVVIEGIVFKSGSDLTTPYTGMVIWRHDNSKRRLESYCEAGIWNGPSKWWYKNEKIAGEGNYKEGKWEGNYREWHENGELKVQVTFKNGKEEGKEIWYHDNGKIRSVTPYKTGRKEGKSEGYFASGIKNWEANWENNRPNGEYWEWHENGDKRSVLRYVKGQRNGREEHWYKGEGESQGKQQKSWEVEWVNDKKQGIERHWYSSSNGLKWMTYESGVLNGKAESFYENGSRESISIFQNGKETYRRQWDEKGSEMPDGAIGQVSSGTTGQSSRLPGREYLWTQKSITDKCKGKTTAEIERVFGKAEPGPEGTWMYRGIKVQHPQSKQYIAATVYFTIQADKVVKTKIMAQ